MRPPPKDWPRLSISIFYDDPRAAISWLSKAFGFEPRIVVDGEAGSVLHSALLFGDAVVMVGQAGPMGSSPAKLGGSTAGMFIYVDDADAHYERAKGAGAVTTREPSTVDYGPEYWTDHGYSCTDPEGHSWHFARRVAR